MQYISEVFVRSTGVGRHLCPVCNGGQGWEKSLNIWVDGGYVMAKCHRASCGSFSKFFAYGGYQGTGGEQISAPRASPEVLAPYTMPYGEMDAHQTARFREKYGFIAHYVYMSYGAMIIPILDPRGGIRGHVLKTGLFPGEHKRNQIYKAKHEPMISWANCVGALTWDDVWLVEDQISALKLAAYGQRSCALLGTHLTTDAVAEIQRTCKHVTIALDADATAKAFRLARRWGAAFKSCQVKILEKDIKDDPKYNTLDSPVHPTPGSITCLNNFRGAADWRFAHREA